MHLDIRGNSVGEPPADRWIVERVNESIWFMIPPERFEDTEPEFLRGIKAIEKGKVDKAARMFEKVLRIAPDHIGALGQMALIHDGKGETDRAVELWRSAIRLGRNAFEGFPKKRIRLPWVVVENRPFLSCFRGLALTLVEMGEREEVIAVLEEVISYDPIDGQGLRELLLESYLLDDDNDKALRLCKRYRGDLLAGTMYGLPLLLFRAGREGKAGKALASALRGYPRIADELLKTEHAPPREMYADHVRLDGWDQAHAYWEDFGRFWDEPALEWLRKERNDGRTAGTRKRTIRKKRLRR
jgi:tetratricopeptide (TPR) repeat protein